VNSPPLKEMGLRTFGLPQGVLVTHATQFTLLLAIPKSLQVSFVNIAILISTLATFDNIS